MQACGPLKDAGPGKSAGQPHRAGQNLPPPLRAMASFPS